MAKRGRTKGETSKKILIKDELIAPYVISVDQGGYILHKEDDITNQRYFTSLPLAIKSILKRKLLPITDETQYTIKQYIEAMTEVKNEMAKLLEPEYHRV